MTFDLNKIDDAVLALLYLTLDPKDHRAWKTIIFEAMDRLHAKGLILDPVSKTKSVVLTEEGMAAAERLARKLFGKN